MQLIQSDAGGGKTTHIINQILHQKSKYLWKSVWVLLPNELQIQHFRDRLIAANDGNVLFGVQYFQFYQLYRQLLNRLHLSQRHIGRNGVVQLLQQILEAQPLVYFEPIATYPGFVQLLAGFIQEMKQAYIQPEDLQAYAEHTNNP